MGHFEIIDDSDASTHAGEMDFADDAIGLIGSAAMLLTAFAHAAPYLGFKKIAK